MTIIRKIINWFKRLFQKILGKKKTGSENKTIKLKDKKKKKYQMGINTFDESIPSYLIIDSNDKDKLLYSIAILQNFLMDNNKKIIEKDEKELINTIKAITKKDTSILEEKEDFLSLKDIESFVKDLNMDEKKEILNRYDVIIKKEEDFKIHLREVEKTVDLIKKNDILIMTESAIYKDISDMENDKLIMDNDCVKLDNFYKLVSLYIDNIDTDFLNNVLRDYNKVNYITVASTIIDNSIDAYKKLEDDFHHHRYNKYYYEREINRIKQEMNKVKKLKNKKEVNEHILKLRKELYTKSKDKYDLLYNNEVFMNLEKECDNLLEKLNTKVVDIKKEEVKEEVKDEQKKYLENILLRFQDLELARKLILLSQIEDGKFEDKNNISIYIERMYERFNVGQIDEFNFKRNKSKTELVILFNDINKITSMVKKEPYIVIEHINFKMDDLLEAVEIKNQELTNIIKVNDIKVNEEKTIDDKLNLLQGKPNKKKDNGRVLKKTNVHKE